MLHENLKEKVKLNPDFNSIYIHWPFCPYRCSFCPFVTVVGKDDFMGRYNNALKAEISALQTGEKKQKIKTIYVGGGTPSTWPEELLLDTFDTLNKTFDLTELEEFCLEVNPGTVSESKFRTWKAIGVNRISVGVQSLKNDVLKSLDRNQSKEDVLNLLEVAPNYFKNISVDLILGLPGVTEDDWQDLLNDIVKWPIKHISVYFLTIHEGTKLYFGIRRGQVSLPKDESYIDMYCWTVEFLKQNGFMQYEISNFAKDEFKSKHNTVYWSRKPFRAFGVGACSFDGKIRFQNDKRFLNYIEAIESGADAICFSEELSKEQEKLEILMLGIRRTEGVSIKELSSIFSDEEMNRIYEKVKSFQESGLLQYDKDKICLTQRGMGMENEIVLQLVS